MKDLNTEQIFFLYLMAVNVLAFLLFGLDKWKAKHKKWRIPEATLLGIAVIGGSIGALLGMMVWHHKTKHKNFRIGIPVILMAQIALLLFTSCKTSKNVQEIESVTIVGTPGMEHSATVFLVMYDKEIGKEPLLKAVKEVGAEIIYDYHNFAGMAIKKPDDRSLEDTMKYFKGVKGVLTVEYDRVYHLTDPVKPRVVVE